MAQHDYIIANQSGAAFRADLNVALAAVATNNSQDTGTSQPDTTYRFQWWADPGTGLLKIRNAANNAWITVGTLADANLGLAPLASPTFTGTVTIPAGASISGFAPLASPTLTGTPAAPTASVGTNTTQLATTAFVLANSLPTTGGTLTGNLTVPSLNGGPLAGFRNRIINGNCQIDQRAAVVTTNDAYFADRWQVSASTTGAYQCSQSNDAPTGFTNSLVFDVTTADTSIAASEFAIIQQHIEGSSISDLSWGGASAQAITLSFWVKSTTTGTYCISLRNSASNRSYVAEYSVVSANTWERKTITIPGDTSGTWLTTNGRGISVTFSFAAGSTFQATAGSWQAGNFLGTSSQANLLALTSNEIRITGVQLEPGSVATPFEQRPIGTELALCQRYYCEQIACAQSASIGTMLTPVYFPVEMRATPTTTNVLAGTSSTASALAINPRNTTSAYFQISATGADGFVIDRLDAYSAEL